ncbi:MAG: hypothetical protein M1156_01325 [Candidatus Marsarchaeota archaeon]|jgi:hypothetical protein|nr:hypothetical protein [Candidatus Marsarchaeota archaeon]
MSIKYWEFEDAPLKEKLKEPSVKEVAKIYFDNETRAYRFATALMEVKKHGSLRLKECSAELPLATWKRYLDFGVTVGILKHENSIYSFTDRYSKPFRNIPIYIKSWIEKEGAEDLSLIFATAKTGRQAHRGGKILPAAAEDKTEERKEEPFIK